MLSAKYKNIVSTNILNESLSDEDFKNNKKAINKIYAFLQSGNIISKYNTFEIIKKTENNETFCFLTAITKNYLNNKIPNSNKNTFGKTPNFYINDTNSKDKSLDIIFTYKTYSLDWSNDKEIIEFNNKKYDVFNIHYLTDRNGYYNTKTIFTDIIRNYFEISYSINKLDSYVNELIINLNIPTSKKLYNKQEKTLKYKNNINYKLSQKEVNSINDIEDLSEDEKDNIRAKAENLTKFGLVDGIKPSNDKFVKKDMDEVSNWHAKNGKHELSLTPDNLIGDEQYRNIKGVYNTACQSLQKYILLNDKENKSKYTSPEVIAAALTESSLKNAAYGHPTNIVSLDATMYGGKKIIRTASDNDKNTDWSSNKFKETVGHKILLLVSTKPVEVLSPMVFLNMKDIIWGRDGNYTSKQILNVLFGPDEVFRQGLIQFPGNNEELIDSVVAIKAKGGYKRIGISTKGGINGAGAAANIVSLFKMILNNVEKNNQYNDELFSICDKTNSLKSWLNSNLNSWGKELYKTYKTSIPLIVLFGGITNKLHEDLFEKLKNNNGIGNISISPKDDFSNFIKNINNNNRDDNISDCIMKILDRQKYDFAQMNCTPSFIGNSFKYTYSIQYPSHYEGDVKLELGKSISEKDGEYRFVKFHIMEQFKA